MQFTSIVAAAGLMAVAAAQNGTVWTTEVVTSYTTYCPAATTFTHGNVTYTATASQIVTVTNCPCTLTKPANGPAATGGASPYVNGTQPGQAGAPGAGSSAKPTVVAPTAGAPGVSNAPGASAGSTGAGSPSGPKASASAIATGAGAQVVPAAGLAGLVGLAAFLL